MHNKLPVRSFAVLPAALAAAIGWLALHGSLAYASNFDGAAISYSQGAHQYFAGNWTDAQRHLTQAIELNPDDPRPYFFRAMARLRKGLSDQARLDMAAGARLEAQLPGRYDVGAALQRVQGPERLLLESYRREARIAESQQRHVHAQLRYEQLERREPEVQRQKAEVRLDEFVDPAVAKQLIASPISPGTDQPAAPAEEGQDTFEAFQDDPFADDPVETESETAEASVEQTPGKISSGKLLGVLGRAVQRTIPIPALNRSSGAPSESPPTDQDDFGISAEPEPLPPQETPQEEEDLFGEEMAEEDPFGDSE